MHAKKHGHVKERGGVQGEEKYFITKEVSGLNVKVSCLFHSRVYINKLISP